MRAKTVYESVDFTRGRDAKSSMELGIVQQIKDDMEEDGIPWEGLEKALRWSAEEGRLDYVKYIVQSGASYDTPDSDGWTPLMGAAASGHTGVVEYLLSLGANTAQEDYYGNTPSTWAVLHGYRDIANLIYVHEKNTRS